MSALIRPIAIKYFRNINKVDIKFDNSPVTIADKLIEEKIRELLNLEFPSHPIFGEEYGGSLDEKISWCIDPIDGTRAFIAGKPIFGTLIALCSNEKPIIGSIDMPCLDELYIGFFDEVQNLSSVKMNGKFISASKKVIYQMRLLPHPLQMPFLKKAFKNFRKFQKNAKIPIMEAIVITMRYLPLVT